MTWLDSAEETLEIEAETGKKVDTAKRWSPDPGDVVKGTLIEAKARTGKYGTYFLLYIDDGKDVHEVQSKTRVVDALFVQNPALNKGIIIRYDGKAEGEYGAQLYYLDSEPHATEAESNHWQDWWLQLPVKAQAMAEMKAAAKPASEPKHNGSADEGDLEAPF